MAFTVYNPYTCQPLTTLEHTPWQELDTWLDVHRQFPELSVPALHERVAILEKYVQWLEGNRDRLILTAIREGGKPYRDTVIEFNRVVQSVKVTLGALYQSPGSVVPMGMTAASEGKVSYTIRKPIGIVLAISAFNHPLNLIIHQVVPTIAVGCPVIIKPSLLTPLSCLALVSGLVDCGWPSSLIQVAFVENPEAERLASDKRVAYVSFIGSARVGWHLRSRIAPGTRIGLEHGGVAPVLIDQEYDFRPILPKIIKGAYYHAGQVCVSIQKVFVPETAIDLFVNEITPLISSLSVGDPELEMTDVGPIITVPERERIHQWVSACCEQRPETLLCGGYLSGETCYAPTLLVNPPEDALVSTREIFGPVLCVYTYKQLPEAIQRVNALPYGFQASVFTDKLATTWLCTNRLKASHVLVNEQTAFRVDWMPFGGIDESGLGLGGMHYTMNEYSYSKMITWQT